MKKSSKKNETISTKSTVRNSVKNPTRGKRKNLITEESSNNESIVTVENVVRKNVKNVTFKLYIDKTDFLYIFKRAYFAQVQDKVYLRILEFKNDKGEPYYRLALKGVVIGALYPTTDESELSFNTIALDDYAITRILNTQFLYKDRLKSVFWIKEIRYVRNDEHKHIKLVTIPVEDGLSVGSAFMHNR
jgi:uncharacterized protein (DUF736 family)